MGPARPLAGVFLARPEASRTAWRHAIASDPLAQAFHSPEWLDFVCAEGGYRDATKVYRTTDGRTLVLPMVRRGPAGAAVVQGSFPYSWGQGGIVSAEPVRPGDVAAICAELGREQGVLRTVVRPVSRMSDAWRVAELPGVKAVPRLSHVLPLDGDFPHVWQHRFTGTARTAVRKAERAGLVVERDVTGAHLPEFYALLEESVTRWARQQHEPLLLSRWRARRRDPLSKFQAMARHLPTRFNLYLARLDGRAVAGIIVLAGTGAAYVNGAMHKELAGPTRANYLLHRAAIEDAILAGSSHYDFGESGGSRELAQFKTRFGARPELHHEFVVERLPFTELDRSMRSAVKRVIGFEEPGPPTATAGTGAA